MTYLLKINDRRYEIPNFVIWSPSYASAKTLVFEGSISSLNCYSYVSLFHPEDEFSFKEMRMCSQPKISSSCFCVWSKSKELGDRGSTRFPASMVESFSADFFSSYRRLLDRVAVRIFSNINDRATLRKYVERL